MEARPGCGNRRAAKPESGNHPSLAMNITAIAKTVNFPTANRSLALSWLVGENHYLLRCNQAR